MKTKLFKYNSNMRLEIGEMAINLDIEHLYSLWSNMMNKAKIDISNYTIRGAYRPVGETPWDECVEIDKVTIKKIDSEDTLEDME